MEYAICVVRPLGGSGKCVLTVDVPDRLPTKETGWDASESDFITHNLE